MTTEHVTILFSDMVGSTQLSLSLDPDEADQVRRRHFSILRQAVASTDGIEVKNLGDGLMVAFRAASNALSCAAAMQQGVTQHNGSLDHPVGLRVGLSAGEVSNESGDYFGDPVIEAARLCALCEGGQILAADIVRLTAGRRSRHQCASVGKLVLKGLPDPVETVEVRWEPLAQTESVVSVPLPARMAVLPQAGVVVGLSHELKAVASAVQRVQDNGGLEVVLISGEAGQGKSTLAAEAGRIAHGRGACVLFGHCEEDLATPYQLFAEALGHYVTHATEDQLLTHVATHGSELSRLVPALSRRLSDLPVSRATDSDSERYLLFSAVVGLLSTASKEQPLLLVFDDLQWADNGSLMLLRHVAASDVAMRVLVLGTYRDTELAGSDALVEAIGTLRRQGTVTRLELAGLDVSGVTSLMEATAGHSLDDAAIALAHAVHQETDGNPFFVSEVLRHLSETGAIYQDATGKWTADEDFSLLNLPDSVREVIRARVVHLGSDAGRVLSLAAVIGRDFDFELLQRASQLSEDDLLDVLDAAASVSVIRELANAPGRYMFSHALIQHTLYDDFGPTRRARAHRRVADALEGLLGDDPGARVGELARHWFNSTQSSDLVKAIAYSRRAGDAALVALAPDDALRYYDQALSMFVQTENSEPLLALDIRIGIGTAQRQTGNPAFRETLLDAAHRAAELGDTDRLVAAALANDRGTFSTVDSVDAEKLEVLEMALDRLSGDHSSRALLLSALCSESTIGSSLALREELAREAIRFAELSGDDVVMVRVLNHVLIPLAVPSLLDQSLARSAESLRRAERLGDPLLLCSAASGRRYMAACAGDIVEMDRCFAIKDPLVEQLDQPFLAWVHALQRSTRALIAGDTDEAEALASEAYAIGSSGGEPDAIVVLGAQMLMVSIWRGTLSQLVPLIEQAIADNPGLPVFVAALALAHAEGERYEEAKALLHEFGDNGYQLPMDAPWLTGMIAYADAAVDCGDTASTEAMLEQLAPFSQQWHYSDISTAGPISRTLGGLATVLRRYDEADLYFAHAATSSKQAGAKFFAARTNLNWGKMLVARNGPGDAERARDLLGIAHDSAIAHRYGKIEEQAAAALRDIG
jgi:class 3 adenylate cyclase